MTGRSWDLKKKRQTRISDIPRNRRKTREKESKTTGGKLFYTTSKVFQKGKGKALPLSFYSFSEEDGEDNKDSDVVKSQTKQDNQ